MKHTYAENGSEYIVETHPDDMPEDGKQMIKFIARVNKSRGRFPKPKRVPSESLTPLIDFDTAVQNIQKMS